MANAIRNQIIGVCRFSYLSVGGFEASTQNLDKLASELYQIARMQRRFALFESLTLPSLAAQTDPDFTLVALIGESMPHRWRRKLKNLMEPYPFLQVVTMEPAGPLNASRRAFRRATREDTDFVTGFRIDDDDAVAVDYIARTRDIADTLLRLGWAGADRPVAIAFERGLYFDLQDKEAPFHDMSEIAPLGQASAMITPAEMQENIFRWNHRRLIAHVPCWTDPSDLMFIRTLHQFNDSNKSVPPGAEPLAMPKARAVLAERFGLDAARVLPLLYRNRGIFGKEDDEDSGSTPA